MSPKARYCYLGLIAEARFGLEEVRAALASYALATDEPDHRIVEAADLLDAAVRELDALLQV